MAAVEPSRGRRIAAIRLNVADLHRAAAFYTAGLGFAVERHAAGEMTLALGGERLELVQAPADAVPYPADPAANDPWFQHFAIRVRDMDAAYGCLMGQGPLPISTGGPQQLPPSTGSVIAYKFRDPDGHPLELSFVPGALAAPGSSPFVAIDHSAIAVADIAASLAFWIGQIGLRETARLLNQGPTQWRLDGLDGALVDIVVLEFAGGGPHLELLHYRQPRSARTSPIGDDRAIAATRLVVRDEDRQAPAHLIDPDGHRVTLRADDARPGND